MLDAALKRYTTLERAERVGSGLVHALRNNHDGDVFNQLREWCQNYRCIWVYVSSRRTAGLERHRTFRGQKFKPGWQSGARPRCSSGSRSSHGSGRLVPCSRVGVWNGVPAGQHPSCSDCSCITALHGGCVRRQQQVARIQEATDEQLTNSANLAQVHAALWRMMIAS